MCYIIRYVGRYISDKDDDDDDHINNSCMVHCVQLFLFCWKV